MKKGRIAKPYSFDEIAKYFALLIFMSHVAVLIATFICFSKKSHKKRPHLAAINSILLNNLECVGLTNEHIETYRKVVINMCLCKYLPLRTRLYNFFLM